MCNVGVPIARWTLLHKPMGSDNFNPRQTSCLLPMNEQKHLHHGEGLHFFRGPGATTGAVLFVFVFTGKSEKRRRRSRRSWPKDAGRLFGGYGYFRRMMGRRAIHEGWSASSVRNSSILKQGLPLQNHIPTIKRPAAFLWTPP